MTEHRLYRLDALAEDGVNPLTHAAYDDSWAVFMLTESRDYQQFVGSVNGCAYTVKCSRYADADWRFSLGDFTAYNASIGKNVILVLPEAELAEAQNAYAGHCFNDAFLRSGEPPCLVHSTTAEAYRQIHHDGMLKSFNRLALREAPIGAQLGDPADFRDFIMFCSGGVTGELVVLSKQRGQIVMDVNASYTPGARLYFDAEKIARDGLLIRDGCHLKVRDQLPLAPYLLFAATAESVGLETSRSTPKAFSEKADQFFFSNQL